MNWALFSDEKKNFKTTILSWNVINHNFHSHFLQLCRSQNKHVWHLLSKCTIYSYVYIWILKHICSMILISLLSVFLIFIYFSFFKFYFIFKLYIIVLVLPNIKMNPTQLSVEYLSFVLPNPFSILLSSSSFQDAQLHKRIHEFLCSLFT